jgi:hypothetical protein
MVYRTAEAHVNPGRKYVEPHVILASLPFISLSDECIKVEFNCSRRQRSRIVMSYLMNLDPRDHSSIKDEDLSEQARLRM